MKFLITFTLCLSSLISASALAQNLSAEQKAKLNALPPSLRAQAMDEIEKFQASQAPASRPLEQPRVVTPTLVQPSNESAFNIANKDAAPTAEETPNQRETDTDDLTQFGYDLFAGSPTTFAPVTEIPVPVNYVIGPGDQIHIQFFGKESNSYDLYVTRNGLLQIPELGPISVAGQSFDEVKAEISERVSEQMIGVKVFLSLGELRSIRIFVLGDANRPGSYTVSSLSTMINALFVSGGIKPIGSLRNVQLKRQGVIVNTLDLYDLLLNGDSSSDKERLQPGDVLFIPPVGRLAGVAGKVKRPAIYELKKDEDDIQTLIDMAGGFAATAYTPLSQLERISASGLKEVEDLDLSENAPFGTELRDGDLLRIFSNIDRTDNVVLLEGQAERPGAYQWSEGMRITDLIDGYNAIVPSADLQYALVVSRNLRNGRISTRSFSLEDALTNSNSPHNLTLRKRDRVLIFENTTTDNTDGRLLLQPVISSLERQSTSDEPEKIVEINGYVRFPGRYPLEEEMKIQDLVRAAGGFSQEAYTLDAELIRFDDNRKSQRETIIIPVKLDSGTTGLDLSLRSFDQLLIKPVPDWREPESIIVRGEVKFPGTYAVGRGETLSSVLRRAGGVTDLAYPKAAVFFRESLRKSESQQIERLRNRLQQDISASNLENEASAAESIGTAKKSRRATRLCGNSRKTRDRSSGRIGNNHIRARRYAQRWR
jgi:protein involved in polysaccharide export with SLBB domain